MFNFVHDYKVTTHFSDDELGKNLFLYLGKHGLFCQQNNCLFVIQVSNFKLRTVLFYNWVSHF
jgi:hypothetical protein